jgi:hypothetical protein
METRLERANGSFSKEVTATALVPPFRVDRGGFDDLIVRTDLNSVSAGTEAHITIRVRPLTSTFADDASDARGICETIVGFEIELSFIDVFKIRSEPEVFRYRGTTESGFLPGMSIEGDYYSSEYLTMSVDEAHQQAAESK